MADKKEMKIFTLSEYEEEEQYLNQMAGVGICLRKSLCREFTISGRQLR